MLWGRILEFSLGMTLGSTENDYKRVIAVPSVDVVMLVALAQIWIGVEYLLVC